MDFLDHFLKELDHLNWEIFDLVTESVNYDSGRVHLLRVIQQGGQPFGSRRIFTATQDRSWVKQKYPFWSPRPTSVQTDANLFYKCYNICAGRDTPVHLPAEISAG